MDVTTHTTVHSRPFFGKPVSKWLPKRHGHRQRTLRTVRSQYVDRTAKLRELLASPGVLLGPCCHDALSAKLIERAGFPFTFMSGFTTSAARLARPDAGLITYSEMVDTGRSIHEATQSIPVIGDGDNGYGNPLNTKRTVKGYATAGFAGILIEDQVLPKSCGHVQGKRVVSREEALGRIKAAVDAREEGKDIAILARTDARQAESLEESLWRVSAFADQGADILFIDALASVDEMRAFCKIRPDVPKLANMLEGGGKTPILLPPDLEDIGFKLVAYPLSLLGVSIGAMEDALGQLKRGRIPSMPSFSEIQEVVGFPEYFEEQEKYAAVNFQSNGSPESQPEPEKEEDVQTEASVSEDQSGSGVEEQGMRTVVVEPDAVITPEGGSVQGSVNESVDATALTQRPDSDEGEQKSSAEPKEIRLRIVEIATGKVKLETSIPATFLAGLSSLIPETGIVDLDAQIKKALTGKWEPSKPVISVPSGSSMIEVYFE